MEKKLKMKRWQIATLAVLFVLTMGTIFIVNMSLDQGNMVLAAQDVETGGAAADASDEPDITNTADQTPQQVAPNVTDTAPSPSIDTIQYSDGVTVTTDASGDQTITHDWGGSDPATKPTPSETENSTDTSTTPDANTDPSPKISPGPSPSPSNNSSSSTPKNGATKTENGEVYTYLEGFGWVKGQQAESSSAPMDMETSGEYVGSLG